MKRFVIVNIRFYSWKNEMLKSIIVIIHSAVFVLYKERYKDREINLWLDAFTSSDIGYQTMK